MNMFVDKQSSGLFISGPEDAKSQPFVGKPRTRRHTHTHTHTSGHVQAHAMLAHARNCTNARMPRHALTFTLVRKRNDIVQADFRA